MFYYLEILLFCIFFLSTEIIFPKSFSCVKLIICLLFFCAAGTLLRMLLEPVLPISSLVVSWFILYLLSALSLVNANAAFRCLFTSYI